MRPIDADALYERFEGSGWYCNADRDDIAEELLLDAPTLTLDDFGIVQCKNCKYWQDNNEGYPHPECRWGRGETPGPDDYCSFGAKLTRRRMKYKVFYSGWYIVEADSIDDALHKTTRDHRAVEYEEWKNVEAEEWGGGK